LFKHGHLSFMHSYVAQNPALFWRRGVSVINPCYPHIFGLRVQMAIAMFMLMSKLPTPINPRCQVFRNKGSGSV
jgi:hypothetical protein